MHLVRLLRTATFRFSALYAAVFGLSVPVLSGIVYWIAGAALLRQLDQRIGREAATLVSEYRDRTTPGSGLELSLVKAVANLHNARVSLRDNNPGLCVQLRIPTCRR